MLVTISTLPIGLTVASTTDFFSMSPAIFTISGFGISLFPSPGIICA